MNFLKTIPSYLGTALIAVMLTAGVNAAFAGTWAPATGVPPVGNADAPITLGTAGQIKSGGLTLNTSGATYGLLVQNGNVGIGTSTPGYKLSVNGTLYATGLRLKDGYQTAGRVLVSDNAGNAQWGDLSDVTLCSTVTTGDDGVYSNAADWNEGYRILDLSKNLINLCNSSLPNPGCVIRVAKVSGASAPYTYAFDSSPIYFSQPDDLSSAQHWYDTTDGSTAVNGDGVAATILTYSGVYIYDDCSVTPSACGVSMTGHRAGEPYIINKLEDRMDQVLVRDNSNTANYIVSVCAL